jgi:hypothetical protein
MDNLSRFRQRSLASDHVQRKKKRYITPESAIQYIISDMKKASRLYEPLSDVAESVCNDAPAGSLEQGCGSRVRMCALATSRSNRRATWHQDRCSSREARRLLAIQAGITYASVGTYVPLWVSRTQSGTSCHAAQGERVLSSIDKS